MVDGVGITLAPEPRRVGAQREAAPVGVDLDAAGVVELALAEDQPGEDEKAAGQPADLDPPLHRRLVARGGNRDGDGAVVELVEPPAVAEADLEDRGLAEEAPARAGVDQDAEAAGAGDVVGIARRGKEPVERGVADRQQRREDPVHPGGDAHGRRVEEHALAGAQHGAVAAHDRAVLLAQDDVAVVRAVADEEGDEATVDPLFLDALGVPLVNGLGIERGSGEDRRVLQQAADARAG